MARGNKLNAMQLRTLIKPGRYGDGNNLWLQVRSPHNRSWLFRYMVGGKAKWLGLGPEPAVSLAQARQLAAKARELLAQKIDPLELRRAQRAETLREQSIRTFREVAGEFLVGQEVAWRNAKHRAQWRSTLETYAYPQIGAKKVHEVDITDIKAILDPIWTKKSETASRLRGRIESILDYAAVHNWRSGENPARWRGHLDKVFPAISRVAKVEHHAALPWAEVPALMKRLESEHGVAAQALRLLILLAARTGEVTGAKWIEIDHEKAVWTIPAERMKAKVEHRIPLPNAALRILHERLVAAERLLFADKNPGAESLQFVFPGARKGKSLSNMSMAMTLRRIDLGHVTVHGFRSAFRDWTAECTSTPREIAEAALAHSNKNKVETAYLRGDHLEKRRRLMEDWAAYCLSAK